MKKIWVRSGKARLFLLAGRIQTIKSIAGRKNIKKILPVLSPKQANLRCFPTKLCQKSTSTVHQRGRKKYFEGCSLAMSGLDHGLASGLVRGPHYTLIRMLRATFRTLTKFAGRMLLPFGSIIKTFQMLFIFYKNFPLNVAKIRT